MSSNDFSEVEVDDDDDDDEGLTCGNVWGFLHGKIDHLLVFKAGLDGDEYVNRSLITMYKRCGEMGFARMVFDEMGERELASWNSMISGYSKTSFAKEAFGLFMEMREKGFEPNEMTLVSVLGSCGDLGLGRWVEGIVLEKKVEVHSHVESALIDMYGKCRDLISARRVFDSMPNKDVVTWNAIITGSLDRLYTLCSQNGASNEVIVLFNGMRETGPNPDKVTMIEDLIKKMLGKPYEIVLGSLLGACQRCRNADVGERVIQLFLEMELSDSGKYVILSKIYANMRRWDDSAKTRVLMRQCGVSKTPCSNWIDNLNHHSVNINQLLNEEMKRASCIPNIGCIRGGKVENLVASFSH
ncbi:hypothetical protein NC652_008208 [Populus alba x Populus x berolinensis]|nr:hypothetical protein NC652_008208 [Populus alba x Populus x berolinensis]